MKKSKLIITGIIALLTLLVGCNKDQSGSIDFASINNEKTQIADAYNLSKAFNDTLGMIYDTVAVRFYNPYCLKYDSLFHQGDSMFMVHYSMFGDKMYENGIMMNGYKPSGSMMNGGMMMNYDHIHDMERLMKDTAEVDEYYRYMLQERIKNQTYDQDVYY